MLPGPPADSAGPIRMADFDYTLPPELVAQVPAEPRDAARLLVAPRSGGSFFHGVFRDVGQYLRAGDLLVLNRTRVLAARLIGHRTDAAGGRAELLLLRRTDGRHWEALVRPARRLRPGTALAFGDEQVRATILMRTSAGTAHVEFDTELTPTLLDQIGALPLPPYIRGYRGDPARYQTVYAEEPGSAAAPTAGLHFTPALLAALRDRGIGIAYLTLHVGLDTFRPIHVEDARQHAMHREYYAVGTELQAAVAHTRATGGRIVAVGTTSVRALESAARGPAALAVGEGWTELFITPGYRFRLVDGLITNFHLPRSTLLLLVSALLGRERLLAAYAEAIAAGYRFYSFGDAMLIL